MLGMIFGPDGLVVIVVLGIVLLFGGTKLPALARGLGSASHEFKKGLAEGDTQSDHPKAHVTIERDHLEAIEDARVTPLVVRVESEPRQ